MSLSTSFSTADVQGISVLGISVEIYNAVGTLVGTASFGTAPESPATDYEIIESETDGVYTYAIDGVDLTDTSKFFAQLISVKWTILDEGYDDPVWTLHSADTVTSEATPLVNVVSWAPVTNTVVAAYQIYSKAKDQEDYMLIGFSSWPVFVDAHDYGDPILQQTVKYSIKPIRKEAKIDGSVAFDVGSKIDATKVSFFSTSKDICIVSGQITSVSGETYPEIKVNFYVGHDDTPLFTQQTLLIENRGLFVHVNPVGFFAVPLICGALVTLEIADAGYKAKFVVPHQAHVTLDNLTTISVETKRGP